LFPEYSWWTRGPGDAVCIVGPLHSEPLPSVPDNYRPASADNSHVRFAVPSMIGSFVE
jgi:hypothetical protein